MITRKVSKVNISFATTFIQTFCKLIILFLFLIDGFIRFFSTTFGLHWHIENHISNFRFHNKIWANFCQQISCLFCNYLPTMYRRPMWVKCLFRFISCANTTNVFQETDQTGMAISNDNYKLILPDLAIDRSFSTAFTAANCYRTFAIGYGGNIAFGQFTKFVHCFLLYGTMNYSTLVEL